MKSKLGRCESTRLPVSGPYNITSSPHLRKRSDDCHPHDCRKNSRLEFCPSVCRTFALDSEMSDAFVVVMQGDKPTFLDRENVVTIHCQECGQRITESEGAKVTFTRDAQRETDNHSRFYAQPVLVAVTGKPPLRGSSFTSSSKPWLRVSE